MTPSRLIVRVFDGDRAAMDDAVVEFWQRGSGVADGRSVEPTAHCGRAATGPDGACEIVMTRCRSRTPHSAAHVNLCLFARGLLRQVYTRVYFAGDPALEVGSGARARAGRSASDA